MPTYSYECKCGEIFNGLTTVAERDKVKCPKCGKKAKRLLDAPQGVYHSGPNRGGWHGGTK